MAMAFSVFGWVMLMLAEFLGMFVGGFAVTGGSDWMAFFLLGAFAICGATAILAWHSMERRFGKDWSI